MHDLIHDGFWSQADQRIEEKQDGARRNALQKEIKQTAAGIFVSVFANPQKP